MPSPLTKSEQSLSVFQDGLKVLAGLETTSRFGWTGAAAEQGVYEG